MKKKYITGVVIILLCAMTGCGSKKETTTVATGTDALVLEEISSEDEIPETVSEVVEGEKGSVTIDAEVILPEKYNTCKLLELETNYYYDESLKNLVEQIFDEGSYFLYMPYNKEQIAFLQGKLTELAPLATDEREIMAFEDAQFFLEYDLANLTYEVEEISDEIKFYKVSEDEESTEYICDVFGTIDGKNYYLSVVKSDGAYCYVSLKEWKMRNSDYQCVGDESFDVKLSGNVCSYTKDEAEELALEYVKSLGYEEFAPVRTYNSIYNTTYDGEVNSVDAYTIYLGREYDSVQVPYFYENYSEGYDTNWHFDENGNLQRGSGSEYIRVCVNSEGIAVVEINNPLKVKEVLSTDVTMLSFDTVNEIAKDEAKKMADEWDGYYSTIDEVAFGYDYIYEDSAIVLAPVWYYYEKEDSTRTFAYKHICIEINALDGTVIEGLINAYAF